MKLLDGLKRKMVETEKAVDRTVTLEQAADLMLRASCDVEVIVANGGSSTAGNRAE